jgi:hypothetical protein
MSLVCAVCGVADEGGWVDLSADPEMGRARRKTDAQRRAKIAHFFGEYPAEMADLTEEEFFSDNSTTPPFPPSLPSCAHNTTRAHPTHIRHDTQPTHT